ncbi:hypothetical protein ACFFX0_13455 [Citricoccus parietis]|uniref:Uncharacterized protein n=1 Tax=Citricoccus parietis TaxID=592307 RepID=A0ABV5FZQ9_9MICC
MGPRESLGEGIGVAWAVPTSPVSTMRVPATVATERPRSGKARLVEVWPGEHPALVVMLRPRRLALDPVLPAPSSRTGNTG